LNWYVYILKCSDDSLYTGITNDLNKRVATHNSGKGAKYTKTRTPVSLIYKESFDTKEESLKREIEIKKLKRKQKLDLIN
jgi:putative endonuclease|tara:strand:- start:265 stop:504 length:240 start_codon:yes stop_codon:yes gene_type:complete